MTDPKPSSPRQARFAVSWADLEADLLAQMLRRLYQCERAETDCQAEEENVRRAVDKQFEGRATVFGTSAADYYDAAIRSSQRVKDLIGKQQWLDKRATMYATALLAVQNYRTAHPTRSLPEIVLD